jgi:hypothetical protein
MFFVWGYWIPLMFITVTYGIITGSHMSFYTYFTPLYICLVWWITCAIQDRHRRPIHRIWSTKRHFLIGDITVPIRVLTDSYDYSGITSKLTSFIYPGVYVTGLGQSRLTISPTNEDRYWQPSLCSELTFDRVGHFYDLVGLSCLYEYFRLI